MIQRFVLELITRPGLYICENTVAARPVTFETAEAAEAYLWKSDCLIRLSAKVSVISSIGA